MLFCGMVENLPRWPWDNNKRYVKRPRLRQVHTRMSGSFFHKGITRFQAELCLTVAKEDGSFLVRDSESLTGAYVLCLLHKGKVHQYRVLPGPDGKLHVQSETGTIQRGYSDLTELIADYIKRGPQNGLSSALIHPVAPSTTPDDLDTDDDEDDDYEPPPPMASLPTTPRDTKSFKQNTEPVDLLKKFSQLDLSSYDGQFTMALKDYVERGLQIDASDLNADSSELSEFTKLLEEAAAGLKRELNSFTMKIDLLQDFLKTGDRRSLTSDAKHRLLAPGLPAMMEQLSWIRSEILSLQTQAQETVRLASIPSEYEYLDPYLDDSVSTRSGPFLSSTYRPYIPQSKFDVKKLKHGKATKITLTVDLQSGKYSILKQSSKETLNQNTVSQDKILHLIKSTKDKSSLDVVLDGKKKQTYAFTDAHARENFCLQIRQMKNMHSTETDIDQISLFVGTWNMGDSPLNQSLSTWLKCTGSGKCRDRVLGVIPHDMYVIGTQESAMTEKDWVNSLKAALKACVLVDMELLEVTTLWGIRLAVLIKPEYKHYISRIQRASVRTGIANALGNKGAVAISFYFSGTSFCFINTHLTSGGERCTRRNQNYRDIIKSLTMSLGQKHLNKFDITNQFQHVFWLGDLNYRLDEDVKVILHKVQEKDICYLLDKDQLRLAQRDRVAFCGFTEADIAFLPTYRLERNMPGHQYVWRKVKKTGERINVPSWCDRVLWRSYPDVFIENVAYGCSDAILSSDHRPVFTSFNIGISSEFVHSRRSLAEMSPVKIIFHSIQAQVKTCCKQYFQLVFHSTCLQDVYKSQSNILFHENQTGFYTIPEWQSCNLPELKPLFGDQTYLEEQHILISVISREEENESYGECVISLRNMFSDTPQEFESILLHQGEETGSLKGRMCIVSVASTRNRLQSSSKKSYSLIAFDTEYHDPEMFISDKPTMVPRRDKGGASMVVKSRNQTKPPLRGVVSCLDEVAVFDDKDSAMRKELTLKLSARGPQPLPGQPAIPPRKTLTDRSTINGGLSSMDLSLVQGTGSRLGHSPVQGTSSVAPGTGSLVQGTGNQTLVSQVKQTAVSQRQVHSPVHGTGSVSQLQGHVQATSSGTTGSQPPEVPPPPIPKKTRPSMMEHQRYDDIKRPSTLDDWLAGLNLSCYELNFVRHGWDSLLYMNELTASDLDKMDITIAEHQDRILASLRELNKV